MGSPPHSGVALPKVNGCQVTEVDFATDLLSLHRYHPERYPFLLESVASGTENSRYDILFAFPQQRLIQRSPQPLGEGDFLSCFDTQWGAEQITPLTSELPFSGGWFLYLSYELAQEIEPTLQLPLKNGADRGLPLALAARIPAALIRDHHQRRLYWVVETAYAALIPQLQADLDAVMVLAATVDASPSDATLVEEAPLPFLQGVERIKEYIYAGDVFQVNLSRRWRSTQPYTAPPIGLYERLRRSNPAPFAALAQIDGDYIISSSPERLVRVRGGRVDTRPIAGTHPRAVETQSDWQLSQALLSHPKERAEHIMLIDLERNDLGRICTPGTVRVNELMSLESYPHVHHIVSNIEGELLPGATPGEVLRALFPGGTITGCPKVRCMEIIAELEQQPRGAYTGSLGYINRDGSMDLNILIRTLTLESGTLAFRAGAGIVADSNAALELAETRAKARGMLLATTGAALST